MYINSKLPPKPRSPPKPILQNKPYQHTPTRNPFVSNTNPAKARATASPKPSNHHRRRVKFPGANWPRPAAASELTRRPAGNCSDVTYRYIGMQRLIDDQLAFPESPFVASVYQSPLRREIGYLFASFYIRLAGEVT